MMWMCALLGRAVCQTPTRWGYMQHAVHERPVTPGAWDTCVCDIWVYVRPGGDVCVMCVCVCVCVHVT